MSVKAYTAIRIPGMLPRVSAWIQTYNVADAQNEAGGSRPWVGLLGG